MLDGKSLRLFSPAKLNLFLRVLGGRPDGYHELASLFQAIDLGDWITFQLASEDRFTCSENSLLWGASNLIEKALTLFRKKSGFKFNIHIDMEKKIPLQAGLGGGSSNAATTLWALNALHHFPYTLEELQLWSAEIGSDIPFFFSEGSAYCTGRGEKVRNLPPPNLTMPLFLYKPQEGLSTAEVFNAFQTTHCIPLDPEKLLEDFYTQEPFLHNDLEKAAFHLLPQLHFYKNMLQKQGLSQITLSGTGTTLFGFGQGPTAVKPLNRSPNGWYSPK